MVFFGFYFTYIIYSIAAGISSEISSVLVLSGVSAMDDLHQFGYRPFVILDGVFEIPPKSEDTTYAVTNEELEDAERRASLL